ncbi:MAG: oligosaccharide flippase family protein [Pseudoalteromonas nigrifaciens]
MVATTNSSSERKKGVVLTYVNIILNTLIMLAYTPFMIRYLGQSEYGIYSLGLSILTYIILLDFGFGNAIVIFTSRFISKGDTKGQENLFGTIMLCYLLISTVALALMFLLFNNAELLFSEKMDFKEVEIIKETVIYIAISMAICIPGNIIRSILTAYEKFIFVNVISIARSLLIPFASVLVIIMDGTVVAMVGVVCLANVFTIFSMYIYYKKEIGVKISIFEFDVKTLKIAYNYSVFVFIATIVDQVNWNFGQILVGSKLGAIEIGIYSISIMFCTTFVLLSSAISRVLLPKITKLISAGASNKQLTFEMTKVGRLQSFIVFIVLFGFMVFGSEFIYYWAGTEYRDSYYLTLIILSSLSIPLIQNLGLSILKAKNKFKFRAVSAFVMSIFTIILSIFLVSDYGYWGISISIAITFFILNGIIMNIYYYHLGLNILYFWKEINKVFIPLCVYSILTIFVKNKFEIDSVTQLIVYISIYTFFILTIAYKFSMNDYEKNIILSAINYFRDKLVNKTKLSK